MKEHATELAGLTQRLERAREAGKDAVSKCVGRDDVATRCHLVDEGAQIDGQLFGTDGVPRHQPKGLDVEDEAGRRALGPIVRRALGRDGVVRRVHLDRVVVLGVVPQARLSRRRMRRIPVRDQALFHPRTRTEADRCGHCGGCSAIQWRAISTRRVTQTSSRPAMWSRKRRRPSMRPGRPTIRQCRPMFMIFGVVAPSR